MSMPPEGPPPNARAVHYHVSVYDSSTGNELIFQPSTIFMPGSEEAQDRAVRAQVEALVSSLRESHPGRAVLHSREYELRVPGDPWSVPLPEPGDGGGGGV